MTTKEKNIRQAAARLADAIEDGRKAGLRVVWPANAEGLTAIAISETGKVKQPSPVAAEAT